MKAALYKKWWLVVLGVAVVAAVGWLAVSLFGLGKPSLADAKKCESNNSFVSEGDALTNPSNYSGKCIRILGQVFNKPQVNGSNETAFQVWADPDNSTGSVIIRVEGMPDINNGDFIDAEGVVVGAFNGKNAFNSSISALDVIAASIKKVDRSTVVAAQKTTAVNQSQDQGGFVVKVEKVEFASNETRAYITVSNNSIGKVSFYDFNSKLIQNGIEIKEKAIFDSGTSSVSGDILSSTSQKGVVYFEKSDSSQPIKLHFEAQMESGDFSTLAYDFNINP